jgi:membrane-bound metal-dependent hydrolase YbcI (DUF457 family)
MYAVGHIALGHLVGRVFGRLTGEEVNIPLVWLLSVMPDLDLLVRGLDHRGPSHSVVVAFVVFAPLLLFRFRKSVVYFAVLATHSLIGDYFTGDVMLFWPFSHEGFVSPYIISMRSPLEVYLELALFVVFLGVFVLMRDFERLLNARVESLLLLIPLGALGGSFFMMRHYSGALNVLTLPYLIIVLMIILSISKSLFEGLFGTQRSSLEN